MPLQDLMAPQNITSDADRIAQTEKLVYRTFNVPVSDLGTIEVRDETPTLVFEHNDAPHTLTWHRDMNGVIRWTLDGKRQLVLSTPDRAVAALLAALG